MNQMRVQLILVLTLAWALSSCGLFDEPELEIHMMGIYEAPTGTLGSSTPQYQKYTILGFSAIIDGELIELHEDWEQKEFRIVDRPQRVLSRSIEDFSGQVISDLRVELDPRIVGGNKDQRSLSANLSSAEVLLDQPFELERGRSYTLLLQVKWRNTIADGIMLAPELVLVRK